MASNLIAMASNLLAIEDEKDANQIEFVISSIKSLFSPELAGTVSWHPTRAAAAAAAAAAAMTGKGRLGSRESNGFLGDAGSANQSSLVFLRGFAAEVRSCNPLLEKVPSHSRCSSPTSRCSKHLNFYLLPDRANSLCSQTFSARLAP